AHVDYEGEPDARECLGEVLSVPRREVVERGLRFFDQGEFFESRLTGGRDRERACDFVERRRHGDDDLLLSQRRIGVRVIPGGGEVGEQQRGGLRRGKFLDVGWCAP